jgi:hypothetical protein
MTDNGLAALAAALEKKAPNITTYSRPLDWKNAARAILGPRGVFLPDGPLDAATDGIANATGGNLVLRNSLTYHAEDPRDAAIATLRAAMDGLVEPLGEWLIEMMERNLTPAEATLYDALRAALATTKEAGGG